MQAFFPAQQAGVHIPSAREEAESAGPAEKTPPNIAAVKARLKKLLDNRAMPDILVYRRAQSELTADSRSVPARRYCWDPFSL